MNSSLSKGNKGWEFNTFWEGAGGKQRNTEKTVREELVSLIFQESFRIQKNNFLSNIGWTARVNRMFRKSF
jgi:hypothetical protein